MGKRTFVLGAGVTGLGVGYSSGLPVYEACESPGGICCSYYMRPGESEPLERAPPGELAYRFEVGGGHWLFGASDSMSLFLRSLVELETHVRRSGVYFPRSRHIVPYPLQHNLRFLDDDVRATAIEELLGVESTRDVRTMRDWLVAAFGPTLCDLFFGPFHDMYTAGLWKTIAPQDAHKSPVDRESVRRGAVHAPGREAGYNARFMYPVHGLDVLTRTLAHDCDVRYERRVEKIVPGEWELVFDDGRVVPYSTIVSTLPLNRMVEMTEGVNVDGAPGLSPSVLVVNIGAVPGPACPDEQWLYVPESESGFHRVGFYSNVSASFLPAPNRERGDRVAIYVEKTYASMSEGRGDEQRVCDAIVNELREWGWIGDVDVVHPTWIDVAYTWSQPLSPWRENALAALAACGIYQVGRYARWSFQGIAESLGDGLVVGSCR